MNLLRCAECARHPADIFVYTSTETLESRLWLLWRFCNCYARAADGTMLAMVHFIGKRCRCCSLQLAGQCQREASNQASALDAKGLQLSQRCSRKNLLVGMCSAVLLEQDAMKFCNVVVSDMLLRLKWADLSVSVKDALL